jgi:hypothetical protein
MKDTKAVSISARVTTSTKDKLSALSETLGCSESEALAKAVDAMHAHTVDTTGEPAPDAGVFRHDRALDSIPRAVMQRYEALYELLKRDTPHRKDDLLDPMVCATLICAAAAAWDSQPLPGLFAWESSD